MGEARNLNPNSEQYRGPMPENLIGGAVRVRIGVDAAWLEANPPSALDGDGPRVIPDDKQVVEFQLVGALVKPSTLVPREQWANYQVNLGVVLSMPLDEFKRRAMGQPEEKPAP